MFFESQEANSSKRCNFPPGGSSNFQFLYPNTRQEPNYFTKYPDTKVNYNILNLQQNQSEMKENNSKNRNCSIRTDYLNGKETVNIFKEEYHEQCNQPSIKVTQMPGGNSRVCYAEQP